MMTQLIRHATLKVRMNNKNILVDPMLSEKGKMDPVSNAANEYKNPLVDLPFSVDEILSNVDAVLLTHSHRDHFDDSAVELLPKNLPIFCQPEDEERLKDLNFTNVVGVNQDAHWQGIDIFRTGGQHGTGEIGKQMGPVSGFVLKAENEKTLYIAGDTIWCPEVKEALSCYSPEIIILNGGEAQFLTGDPITMSTKDIEYVSLAAPTSKIIIVHMDAWNHCLLKRDVLASTLQELNLNNVFIPEDGEIFTLR